MGGSGPKVPTPKQPDIGKDISQYVSGYGQALPSVLALEQQYRPEFGKANIADIGQYQQGIQALQSGATQTAQQQLQAAQQAEIAGMTGAAGGARGLMQAISPEGAGLVGQSVQASQAAQQYANQFGQAAQQAYGQYAPDTSRLAQTVADYSPVGAPSQTITGYTGPTLPGQTISDYTPIGMPRQTIMGGDKSFGGLTPNVQQFQLDTSGITGLAQKVYQTADTLSPEQKRAAQQTAREAGMASGRVGGTGTVAAEILNREASKAGRRAEAAQLGGQAFQQQSTAAQIQQANQQALFAQRQAHVGQRQSQAEFNLQRQQAQFGQGAQQAQLGMQQAEQLRATQQAKFGQGTQLAGIQMQSAEQQMANQQAQFGQGLQLSQLGMQQAEQARATQQAQFGQQASAMEQQRAAQAQGFSQFTSLGQQQLQAQEAARMANQQAFGQQQSFYTQPAFGLLGSTPQSYTSGKEFTQYGIGMLGKSTPQMINPDMGANLAAAQRRDVLAAQSANAQAGAAQSAGMMGGIGSAIGGIATAKAFMLCIPSGEFIDTVDGKKLIDEVLPNDKIVGFNGDEVVVLQKHSYGENPEIKRFVRIGFDDDSSISLCDKHKVNHIESQNVQVGDCINKKTVVSIEYFGGVKISYDLLTSDDGYQMSGIPVNSMIPDLINKIIEIQHEQ